MNLLCIILGHKLYIIERLDPHCRKVGCKRCPGKWIMDDRDKSIIEWEETE